MTHALANRKDAIFARLAAGFGIATGIYFDVTLVRAVKKQPRQIRVTWTTYPFETDVINILGDLYADDIVLFRNRLWSCGRIHDDGMAAWLTHEGADHLEYEDGWSDEPVLTDDKEAELRANGETFESACVPGNYAACPTCGGTARILTGRAFTFNPCPDCTRLGLDRSRFRGVLDLDVPDHLAFYQGVIDSVADKARTEAAAAQRKRDAAMNEPTTFAIPQWQPLPTRDAGILNGLPVAERIGCDYLTNADNPERRVLCRATARWFDPTTGLRVCTRHKTTPAKPSTP